jgi:hypothetical protein
MSTRDLVDALISGDSIAIENTFNAAMSDKVSAALDSYRVEVATKMFVPPEENIQQTDDNTSEA